MRTLTERVARAAALAETRDERVHELRSLNPDIGPLLGRDAADEIEGLVATVVQRDLIAKYEREIARMNADTAEQWRDRATKFEDALRLIADEANCAHGGNYQPDIGRWAEAALDVPPIEIRIAREEG